jgi:type IV pilus assembly protein PilB
METARRKEISRLVEPRRSEANGKRPGAPAAVPVPVAALAVPVPVTALAPAAPVAAPAAPAAAPAVPVRVAAPAPAAPAAPASRRKRQSPVGRRFGDLILADGLVTPEQFEHALAEQKKTNEKLGEILVRLGLITEQQLVHFLSSQYGIPEVTFPEKIAPETIRLIPARIARKYSVVPIGRTIGSVTVAVADPTNLSALDDVAFLTGLKVVPTIASPSIIRQAIERHYEATPATMADVLSEVEAEVAEVEILEGRDTAAHVDLNELRSSADQVPVVRLVNSILLDAITRGASDVHMDPSEHIFRVRFRVDGILHEVMTPPKRVEPAVVSRLKIMANLDIAERRLPQDGRIKLRQNGHEVDFRMSVLPALFGESVTLRILDKSALKVDLTQLGFEQASLDEFRKAIQSPNGLILITGPTGAGKTTTLYSALNAVNSPDRNIVTVEDPVEYELQGITQVQVSEEIGRTFATALRSFLRHDPDVILVGEMRDQETAQIAVRAALTGHLVLSTLHTNSAAQTISRLQDMGVPPFLVASSLRVVVAQRLARKVCQKCREPYQLDEASLVQYGHAPLGLGGCTVYKGKGCTTCHGTGMKGRVALYEVLPVSPEIRGLILNSTFASEIQDVASKQGMKTLRETGLLKVLQGVTTVEEILRVTSE